MSAAPKSSGSPAVLRRKRSSKGKVVAPPKEEDYKEFIRCLPTSICELVDENGSVNRDFDVDPDQNFDSLLYSAQLFEQRGSEGSLEFTSHVDRLDSELGKRMGELMLTNEEKAEVADIKLSLLVAELTSCLDLYRNARGQITVSATYAAQNGDHVLALDAKRKFIKQLSQVLSLIRLLRTIEADANDALASGELSQAHHLCKEYDAVLTKELFEASKYGCMKETSERIAQVAVDSLRQLHGSLRPVCIKFDQEKIDNVLVAYQELKAGNELLQRLMSEYTDAIEGSLVINGDDSKSESPSRSKAASFADQFIDTAEALVDVLLSFHRMVEYCHRKTSPDQEDLDSFTDSIGVALGSRREEIWSVAVGGLMSLVEINREKVNTLKPQALGKPLKVARIFHRFGAVFLDLHEEDVLLDCLQELERIYLASFRSMHHKNIELMSVMLRNETWESARISSQDLTSIRKAIKLPVQMANEAIEIDLESGENPIRAMLDGGLSDGGTKAGSSMIELDDDEDTASLAGSSVYTATSLAALRWIGRYVQSCESLLSAVETVGEAILEVFLVYLFNVTEVCNKRRQGSRTLDRVSTLENFLTRSERTMLTRFRRKHGQSEGVGSTGDPALTLHRLCVSVESMWTLSALVDPVVVKVRALLENGSKKAGGSGTGVFDSSSLLAKPIRRAAYVLFSYDVCIGLVRAVGSTGYDLPDKQQEYFAGSSFVEPVSKKIAAAMSQPLVPASAERMSEYICKAVMRSYIEGISNVERCSASGRALMLVDFRSLEDALQKATGMRVIPEAEKVENYIKAYYLNEAELANWVATNCRNYKLSLKQVNSLGEVGPGRFLTAIEKSRLREKITHEYNKAMANKAPSSKAASSDDDNTSAGLFNTANRPASVDALSNASAKPPAVPKLESRPPSLPKVPDPAGRQERVAEPSGPDPTLQPRVSAPQKATISNAEQIVSRSIDSSDGGGNIPDAEAASSPSKGGKKSEKIVGTAAPDPVAERTTLEDGDLGLSSVGTEAKVDNSEHTGSTLDCRHQITADAETHERAAPDSTGQVEKAEEGVKSEQSAAPEGLLGDEPTLSDEREQLDSATQDADGASPSDREKLTREIREESLGNEAKNKGMWNGAEETKEAGRDRADNAESPNRVSPGGEGSDVGVVDVPAADLVENQSVQEEKQVLAALSEKFISLASPKPPETVPESGQQLTSEFRTSRDDSNAAAADQVHVPAGGKGSDVGAVDEAAADPVENQGVQEEKHVVAALSEFISLDSPKPPKAVPESGQQLNSEFRTSGDDSNAAAADQAKDEMEDTRKTSPSSGQVD
ncbi:hypothetical protein NDN08_005476 [Rhodosorus marinus]|uniref:Exocyst complex component Sec8 n=1 Tax=Rhodosorus marinus TaxID=101924 RepID=A0AAV8V598_9RHOD|nr:hypothetical protein NDN08_005476 [Rhodosorus marinus]